MKKLIILTVISVILIGLYLKILFFNKKGTGILATVKFKALTESANTDVDFASTTRAAGIGETSNVLGTMSPSTITITAATISGTPTPTPSISPTVTPTSTLNPSVTVTPTPNPSATITPTPSFALGDLNHDGQVNTDDINVIVSNFAQTNCGNIADLNNDCKVDIIDYSILVSTIESHGQ